ncbi:MAG: 5-formyltetrahydrofolate cyclo-ligase [Pseudomonadota bacterium]
MEEIQVTKRDIRNTVKAAIANMSTDEVKEKTLAIETRLFEFANFLEAGIVMMYINTDGEVDTSSMLKRCYDFNKMVVLPGFNMEKLKVFLFKVENLSTGLAMGLRGILEPNPQQCKKVPIDCIDIAVIPSVALDEKGGRIGTGEGLYDRLIPKLPMTTRKVTLAMEAQIVPQVPMESHDKHVDIIITENRIIYKI